MINHSFDISVIIPVYNAEKYVKKAVESSLQFPEVKEVLLIEDGSPDNALEVCMQLEDQFSRVKLLRHPDKGNHGAGASRNLGLANASCPFIAFLDADDFYLPNRFEADKRIFAKKSDVDGVYNALGIHYYSQDAETIYKSAGMSELTTVTKQVDSLTLFESFIYLNERCGYFSLDGLTIKKEILEKMEYWFNPALPLHQDSEFLTRLTYIARLFPGEIRAPTAKRGVHSENRIVNAQFENKKKNLYQKMFWASLYDWAETQKIPHKYIEHLYRIKFIKSLPSYSFVYRWFLFIFYTAKDRRLFLNPVYYDIIHPHLFGNNKFSHLLLEIKNESFRLFLRVKNKIRHKLV